MNSKYIVLLINAGSNLTAVISVIKEITGKELNEADFRNGVKPIKMCDSNEEAQEIVRLFQDAGGVAVVQEIDINQATTTKTSGGYRMSFNGSEPEITHFQTVTERFHGIPEEMRGGTYVEEIQETENGYVRTIRRQIKTDANSNRDFGSFGETFGMRASGMYNMDKCPMCGSINIEDISYKFTISLRNKLFGKNIRYSCVNCKTRW